MDWVHLAVIDGNDRGDRRLGTEVCVRGAQMALDVRDGFGGADAFGLW